MTKRYRRLIAGLLALTFVGCWVASWILEAAPGAAAKSAGTATSAAAVSPGMAAAQALSTVTGVAISPLLGVGAYGAWQFYHTAKEHRARLPWYARPAFWVPALLLVGLVAAKDIVGTAAPTALKKPFDVAEAIENKVSGLVAAGAFVPLVAAIFPLTTGGDPQAALGGGLAALNPAGLLNVVLMPFALVAFVLVWFLSHAINILIVISPFTTVDAALKSLRLFVLSLVTATAFADPYLGAVFSAGVIVLAYFMAGWSFRWVVFGHVHSWDFLTRRRRRFVPAHATAWMFTAAKLEAAPARTYGRLLRNADDAFVFEYRPWLFLPKRTVALPEGPYAVGRGMLYSEILRLERGADPSQPLLVLPPRYRGHEAELAQLCGIARVQDVGLLKGLKAAGAWCKSLLGDGTGDARVAAAAS